MGGKVYLVGAGPGDPDLLTLRAYRVLREADAVLYDALVSEEVLNLVPEGALKVFVGKRKGRQSLPQEEINRLLYELAAGGLKVVRLKGGDPFVFGRGGEELLYLTERGVEVEVVPGVSSYHSAPALFGVPLTHRGVASTFAVATAHCLGGECADWEALARVDTLVVLMAASRRREVARRLLEAGKDPKTPVLLVSDAYGARQRAVRTTLGELAQNPPPIEPPALIVVGEVAAMASEVPLWSAVSTKGPQKGQKEVPNRRGQKVKGISNR
ncbi:MAG: uroporphyrinogen-III C-methyltransferase [Aquificae bacterium]|nr:uroporphyrinogen-III C-methyltransferase [Aquificota bacterium]